MATTYTVIQNRKGRANTYQGTVSELVEMFSYTLKTGKSYEREKGNKKINTQPKTAKSLVTNLNAAKTNAAANGCSNTYYELEGK